MLAGDLVVSNKNNSALGITVEPFVLGIFRAARRHDFKLVFTRFQSHRVRTAIIFIFTHQRRVKLDVLATVGFAII